MKYKLMIVTIIITVLLAGCDGDTRDKRDDSSAEPAPPPVAAAAEEGRPYTDSDWTVSAKVMWTGAFQAGLQVKFASSKEGAEKPDVRLRHTSDGSMCTGGYRESVGDVDIYVFDIAGDVDFDNYEVCVNGVAIVCDGMGIESGYIDELDNDRYVCIDSVWYLVVERNAGEIKLQPLDGGPAGLAPPVYADSFHYVDAPDDVAVTAVTTSVGADRLLSISYTVSGKDDGYTLLYNYSGSGNLIIKEGVVSDGA